MPTPRLLVSALAAVTAALLLGGVGQSAQAATAPPTVTISVAGDTILGNTPQLPSDPSGYLAPVHAALTSGAQVVFGNLEGTLTSATSGKCGGSNGGSCYAFRNPPSFGSYFAGAGFTVMNTANNHSHDYGSAGLRDTLSAIQRARMTYAGQPGQIDYVTVRGVRVAVVAFAPYSSSNNLLDLRAGASLIRRAHSQASIVLVYMHAGAEGSGADHVTGREEHYLGEDRGNPRAFAHMAVDNGASAVVASGPHVLRGMEFYRQHLIAYSVGNFANFHDFSSSGVLAKSVVLRLTVSSTGAFHSAKLISVVLSRTGQANPGGDSVSFVNGLSQQDFGSAAPVIAANGSVSPRH